MFRSPRLLAWLLLLFPVVLILAYPFAQDYLHAASLLERIANAESRSWIARYDTHPVASPLETRFEFNGRVVAAMLVRPLGVAESAGIVLLAPGQYRDRNAGQLINVALGLAASGYSVMVPEFGDLLNESAADRDSSELVAAAAQACAHELELSKIGLMAPAVLGGVAAFAANTPAGSRSIAWAIAGEPITTALDNPQNFSRLAFGERLSLINWWAALIRQARNSPRSQQGEMPAGALVLFVR